MTTIRLYGSLAKEFGKEFSIQVSSTKEAVAALSANLPGFKQRIFDGTYHVFVSGIGNLAEKDIELRTGARTIKIAPVLKGAGSGNVFRIILGIALLVVSYFLPPGPWKAWTFKVGLSLVLGGVLGMIFAPSIPPPPDAGISDPNFSFNGGLNTVAQGYAVPVGYGRVIVGSAVIGAGIHTSNR